MTVIRRVVVGPESTGGTRVLSDGPAPAVTELPSVPGTALVDLWRSDAVPLPTPTEQDPTAVPFELMPPGSLFRIIDLAPLGDGEPLWHATPTVDFVYVASGSVTLLLEGSEVELTAGDSVVVGGVRHAWANRSDETCRLVDASVAATG